MPKVGGTHEGRLPERFVRDAGWVKRPEKGKGRLAQGDGDPCCGVPDQGLPQPFFLPNESFSVVTRLNTGLSAVWSKRSAT